MNTSVPHDSSAGTRDLTQLVTRIFSAWNASGLRFLVLRNYEQLPACVSNDLDILISCGHRELAERLLIEAAEQAGYRLHNRAEFAPVSLFFHEPETQQQIQVDLFTRLEWRGLEILPTDRVLDRRLPRGGFAVPDPTDEATLNLLTRLLYNGCVREKYRQGILHAFRDRPDAARERLTSPFGSERGGWLVESVQAENWLEIESSTRRLRHTLLRRRLGRHPFRVLRALTRDALRLTQRWLCPPGLTVAVLGPDGCGKSTASLKAIQALRHTFSPDKGLQIHWKPVVFLRKRRRNRPPTTDPHGQPPRGRFLSLLFLLYHWVEYRLGQLTQIHRVTFRNGLVMIDRHYYDFLVDPRRYRLSVPAWAVRWGGALLPRPDLVFVLDAPAEVLQSRKQEVPRSETERQRQAFLGLARTLPNGRVVDASEPPDRVTYAMVDAILNHLERRVRERHHT